MSDDQDNDGGEGDLTPEQLIRLWYERLRYIADRYLASIDRQDITLTGVADEVVKKWLKHPPASINDDRHVMALLHRYVRQIVLDRLRHDATRRAGGGRVRVPLHDAVLIDRPGEGLDMEEFDNALQQLAREHKTGPRMEEILLLRLVCGVPVSGIAAILKIGTATVNRDYRFAIAWLQKRLIDPRS